MYQKFSAHLDLAKSYWTKHLKAGDTVIDATCGNGHDTLFLTQFPLKTLFAIDIQPEAIISTKKLLEKHQASDRVSLHQGSHENFNWLPPHSPFHLIIYNLGYLPRANKNFTTQTKTTLSSLNSATHILADQGALSITCYPGHSEGEKEEIAVLSWAESLCPKQWLVCYHRWMNRKKSPTILWVQRNK